MSLESEAYFKNLLDTYANEIKDISLEDFLDKQIKSNFIALGKRPIWIQSAEWPFGDNLQPMIFVGQIDISTPKGSVASQYFHDDTSFYIFQPQNPGDRKVVVQQF